MEVIEYLDKGYEYFSKALVFTRDIITKVCSFLPWDPRTTLAIITLVVSFYLSFLILKKFTTHPLNARYIVYQVILTWLIFTILFYFTI